MPKVSRETASGAVAPDGLDVRVEHLEGGYSVCFERHTADADLAELFRGLPDDRCQLPRSGSGCAREARSTRRPRVRLLAVREPERCGYVLDGGFMGGEFGGYTGQPEAFARKLREVLGD